MHRSQWIVFFGIQSDASFLLVLWVVRSWYLCFCCFTALWCSLIRFIGKNCEFFIFMHSLNRKKISIFFFLICSTHHQLETIKANSFNSDWFVLLVVPSGLKSRYAPLTFFLANTVLLFSLSSNTPFLIAIHFLFLISKT